MTINHEIRPSRQAPVIISLIFHPEMRGHFFEYHEAIGEAARLNGCHHSVAVPISWQNVKNRLPDNWHVCLDARNIVSSTSRLGFIGAVIPLGISLTRFLRKEMDRNVATTLFIDDFIFWEIPPLLISLFFLPRGNLSVWLLFRYKPDFDSMKQKALKKVVLPIMEMLLKRKNVRLLTDSELVKRTIEGSFKRELTVMPVPHTEDINRLSQKPRRSKDQQVIRCWLPGGPRKDKGIGVVREIASTRSRAARKICLIVGESAQLEQTKNGAGIELIPDFVDRRTYLKLMRTSNIVLLPYKAERYSESTSGIFIEAVIAGSIPLVTPATWMAAELLRYGLQKLITDWQPAEVIPTILAVCRDHEIASRLEAMSRQYSRFHSTDSYALRMKDLLERTDSHHRETSTFIYQKSK